jgi:tRNA modification GTPase
MPFILDDTIAAVATPPGSGGVGVIRISGPDAQRIGERLFICGIAGAALAHGRMRYGRIVDPSDGRVLDEVLAVRFVAPHSFTGQDVLEIHAHGGRLNLQQIVELCLRHGARAAGPGEFSLRAFMNRRVDLTRAEAVRDVIEAQTSAALNASRRQLLGDVAQLCEDARAKLLRVLSHIEALVDFPDEELPQRDATGYMATLAEIRALLQRAAASYARGRLLTEGVEMMIIGAPNVGKSSLLNRLARQERAIVSETPGTTRDLIEGTVEIGGVPVRLVDSAGLREGADAVESIGVARARARIESADLLVWVLDGSRRISADERAMTALAQDRQGVLVVNKSDLTSAVSDEEVAALVPGWPLVRLSARSGAGMDELEARLSDWLLADGSERDAVILTSARHQAAFVAAAEAISRAEGALADAPIWELLAADLHDAMQRLGEVVGVLAPDEILNEIFSSFCIGK